MTGGGALYLLIRPEDLAERRFGRAMFTWQCGGVPRPAREVSGRLPVRPPSAEGTRGRGSAMIA
ncbi:DUF1963 domain-containing protein [Streptomyces sp. NPDC002580]|uniref:DUF1963 domain-containing protein n=1 Tax=Streptomyces sp. NPDC002580 TaxID=3364653 RepID=UPI003673EF2E